MNCLPQWLCHSSRWLTSELARPAINYVVVDNQRMVRAGIVAGVAALTFTGDEFGHALSVDIGEGEGMDLRIRFVDHVLNPVPAGLLALLLQPI